MKLDRTSINALKAAAKLYEFSALAEAIHREAFFQQEILGRGFTMRELYMMCDVAFRPDQNIRAIEAVDKMLDQRGFDA